jgi:hypothetical protein
LHFDSRKAVFVALALAGCGEEAPAPEPAPEPAAPAAAAACGSEGFLTATLGGALQAEVDWRDPTLQCESMRRPDDRGVRLRFTGEVSGERLAIIIAMPHLEAGVTGPEFDSIVTITVEGTGRFFSTPNLGSCWTAVSVNGPLADGKHTVAGTLTCVGPLGEYNGSAFVDVRDLEFSGIADWNAT